MKVIAFLQNQWWKDPDRVRQIIEMSREPEKCRQRMLVYGLMQCKTGMVLMRKIKRVIGGDIFNEIHWENSSRDFGSKSNCKFPPDIEHMQKVINEQDPDVILCFGAIAKEGLDQCTLLSDTDVLYAVHPASRGNLDSLNHMALGIQHLKVEWDG